MSDHGTDDGARIASDEERASELAIILEDADEAYADRCYEEAFELYSEALAIEPDDPHAILWRALSFAWEGTVKDNRIVELDAAANDALSLFRELHGASSSYFDFCNEAIGQIAMITTATTQMFIKFHNDPSFENPLSLMAPGSLSFLKEFAHKGVSDCCDIVQSTIIHMTDGIDDFSEADERFFANLIALLENAQTYRERALMSRDPRLRMRIDYVERLSEEWKRDRIERYLRQDPEADRQCLAIKGEMDSLEQVLESLDERIDECRKAVSSLGPFKRGEKKRLHSELNELEAEAYGKRSRIRELRGRMSEIVMPALVEGR